ncbi:MAG TPA: sulfur oxidation c-type cytochrome SoxA [Aeromonadales bacterium]|nr:sulfur oxidation c-type cytochrome SoxA [Aeromonadales bacterium]
MKKLISVLGIVGLMFLVGCDSSDKNEAKAEAEKSDKVLDVKVIDDGSGHELIDFQQQVLDDAKRFKEFYTSRRPDVDPADFNNGVYAIDSAGREQWEEIEEFPPYEFAVDEGKQLFEIPFPNGQKYSDCFKNGGIGIRQNFPYYEVKSNRVVTLELAINDCRVLNHQQPYEYGQGDIEKIAAYMSFTSRGKKFNLSVPNEAAYNAYLAGKKFFYSRRGQLNMSCENCHMGAFGKMLRADMVGPAYGHTTSSPIYRAAWESIGSLHKRYVECNKNVRAKPFALQSEEYRNLEYFESLMSADLTINGPSSRK